MSFRESGKTSEMWTIRDILYIVIISLIGAIYSTYEPFGQMIQGLLTGIPGAGWAMQGAHTLFILLAFGLTLKYFSATAAGAIKGLFELLFGNTFIGIFIVLQSALVGLLIDVGYFIFKAINKEKADNDESLLSWLLPWTIFAGIGSMLAMPIFYAAGGIWFKISSVIWIAIWIPFISGIIFGALARVIREVIVRAGVPSAIIRE
jgi:hypothetical protein